MLRMTLLAVSAQRCSGDVRTKLWRISQYDMARSPLRKVTLGFEAARHHHGFCHWLSRSIVLLLGAIKIRPL
jgi:hypothetical protein